MIVLVTGTVGLDKRSYLQQAEKICRANGHDFELVHIGDLMYKELPDIASGRILDLPLTTLKSVRRSVFKDVIQKAKCGQHLIINTHATFRWKHGLHPAIDFEQLAQLDSDIYINIIDNVDVQYARMVQEHEVNHSLKDLLVWREEEMLATELLRDGCQLTRCKEKQPASVYQLPLGEDNNTAEMFYRLICEQHLTKAYIGFPMSHVQKLPGVLADIKHFSTEIAKHMIVFDPKDVEEMVLYLRALEASQKGERYIEVAVQQDVMRFDVAEILQVSGDIQAQIYARDFMLIDYADIIISYVPQLPDGRPAISSGVERELQHAHEMAKEVYVIWEPDAVPSPFVTNTATKVFKDVAEALAYFNKCGHITF
jgi:adenylate kinase